MRISTRLLLLFLLVAVLPLALFSYFNLQEDEDTLRTEALGKMSALADKKAIQVKSYLAERLQDVRILARGPRVMREIGIITREYIQGQRNAAAYIREGAGTRQYFDRYVEDEGVFYDVFLITPQGEVVYSQKHEADFAINLLTGPYRDSQLAQAFRAARMTLEPVISGYEFYAPSQAPALFITAPIMVEGKFRGVFAVQLGNELFYRVATDATGLGLSGEAAFAQRDGDGLLVTTPLKHQPDAALKLRLNRQESQQLPMLRALSGEAGAGVTVDYRGKQQLSAWRYLPELDWGMVVKIDADEVFASIYRQRIVMLETVLGLLLFTGVLAYYFGRQISAPLDELARTADEVAQGALDKRVDEAAPGELGLFAQAFNRMAKNLQSLYGTLEQRVEQRTQELNVTNERLQEEIFERERMDKAGRLENDFRKEMINSLPGIFYMLDSSGHFLMWNRNLESVLHCSSEEITRSHALEFFEGTDRVLIEENIRKVFEAGETSVEAVLVARNGTKTPYFFTGRRIDRNGEPVLVGLGIDIAERHREHLELERNQDLLSEAQRLGQLGSWELNLVSGELRWSDEIYRLFELDPAQFSPSYENFLNAIHPDDRDRVNRAYTQSLADRQAYDIQHRLKMADGRIKWVREHCSSDFDAAGKPLRSVGAVQDITEQKLYEDQLRVAAIAFETQEAIMITGPDDRIIRVNKAFERITGYRADEVIGHNPHLLSSGKHDQAFYAAMWQQITGTGQWEGEIWDKRKNGDIYPKWLTVTTVRHPGDGVRNYVGVFSDISQRKLAEEEIYSLAYYDSLTKLPNRRLLQDRFGLALATSERSGSYGVVLFLDMDKFKTLNDTLGHGYGDLLLIEVAARIKNCVREMDTVARMGGDEFVVLIDDVSPDAEEASQKAAHIAEKIRSALAQPYSLEGQEQHSSPSIGVCLYRGQAESVESLLKHADMAMYQAKAAGRNTVCFFDPVMQQSVEARVALEADLRHAVFLEQLHLYYQIQLDNEHRALGAEALLRWIHPTRGMVSPAQFIPLAEETMLIIEIGHWVLESACQQLKQWEQHVTTRHLTIAVNVSAQQFALPDFAGQVAAVLHKHRVDPARLKLELTESVVLDDVQGTIKVMHELKGLGVGLSMDDFGTGYSSLSYLKVLPLDQLKIDRSFVRDITSDPNDAVLVQTIIGMAKNFRLHVIAEGVETEAQLAFLKQHGCMAYQGYLFSKPVPVAEFEALVQRMSG